MNILAQMFGVPEQYYTLFSVLFLILLVVVTLLKGLALWRSARNSQTTWFWVLVFVNTVGILEIIYLLTNKEDGTEKPKIIEEEVEVEEKIIPGIAPEEKAENSTPETKNPEEVASENTEENKSAQGGSEEEQAQ